MKPETSIEKAMERLAAGGLVIMRDDEGRENEGDLVGAASLATPEMVNFMVRHARGLVCQPVTAEVARRLELGPQAPENTDSHGTAFTVSVDAADGITTGISAEDRAVTARVVADGTSVPQDLRRPGHMFPLIARPGGVLERAGHTEGSVDLLRLAGLVPSALICEILNEDGTMARGPQLERLAVEWDMPLVSVADIAAYRRRTGDVTLSESSPADLPTEFGRFRITVFSTDDPMNREAVLLEHAGEHAGKGDGPDGDAAPLVRVHSECLTGDALFSTRCDCGAQLRAAMEGVAREGGAIVYLRQEGRGIGLFEKVKAYTLQDEGMDTLEANLALGHPGDARNYGLAAAVLRQKGYRRVRILTNNPEKARDLQEGGIDVTERLPLHVGRTEDNVRYLTTKFEQMGHIAPEKKGVGTWN
jgi:3,4-dihydroxy 2-butanone 4-phosphate synthase / GTP cyclohydrolase II